MSTFVDSFEVVSLVFFLLVFVGRAFYLRLSRNINPIAVSVRNRGVRGVIELCFFAGLILWVVEVFSYSVHLDFRIFPAPLDTQLFDAIPVKLIGVALVSAGLVIFVLALVAFGDAWRVGIDENAPGELVTTGIFSVSRNPIFLFLDFYFAGTFLINGTLIFLIYAIGVVIGVRYQIIQEERFLGRNYGGAYRDYCAKVGRYFTWRRVQSSAN